MSCACCFFTAPCNWYRVIFGELQIGVLKDSAAFRDAVNLAANITSEPHNYHIFSLIDVEQSRDLPTRHEIATSQRVRLAPSFVIFDGIPQYSLVYSQNNEIMFHVPAPAPAPPGFDHKHAQRIRKQAVGFIMQVGVNGTSACFFFLL